MAIDLSDWMNVQASTQTELDKSKIMVELLEHQIAYIDKKVKAMEAEIKKKPKKDDRPAGCG